MLMKMKMCRIDLQENISEVAVLATIGIRDGLVQSTKLS